MSKTYDVVVVSRIDFVHAEKDIDVEINKNLKMFRQYYKGKESILTKKSDMERRYIFEKMSLANSKRLKKLAENNKTSIQLKAVEIKPTLEQNEQVSKKAKNGKSKKISSKLSKSHSSTSSESKSSPKSESSETSTSSTKSDSSESSKSSKPLAKIDSSGSSKSSTKSDSSESSKSSKSSTKSDSSESSKSSKSSTKSDSSESSKSSKSSSESSKSSTKSDSSESTKSEENVLKKKSTIVEQNYMVDIVNAPPDIGNVNHSRFGPQHDPYLDQFVPDIRDFAPATHNPGISTDPSIMSLMYLTRNKNAKDVEKVKEFLGKMDVDLKSKWNNVGSDPRGNQVTQVLGDEIKKKIVSDEYNDILKSLNITPGAVPGEGNQLSSPNNPIGNGLFQFGNNNQNGNGQQPQGNQQGNVNQQRNQNRRVRQRTGVTSRPSSVSSVASRRGSLTGNIPGMFRTGV